MQTSGWYWILLLVVVMLALHWVWRARAVQAKPSAAPLDLRSLFQPEDQVLGKSLSQLQQLAGEPESFGSFDHGREVAQWRQGELLVEVWFNQQRCESVQIRNEA